MRNKPALLARSAVLILLAAGTPSAQAPTDVLVLTHANVIDGISAQPVREVTIVIRAGRIETVAPGAVAPAGATVLDLNGRWVLPGFVDGHVHIATMAAAREALASGTTTARSMGVDHFVDVGFRELHRSGSLDLPDFLAAGYHVRPQPAEAFFLDFPPLRELLSGVRGAPAVRRMVRAMIDRGADVIKIMATERAGLPETDPRKRVYSDEELAAAVDEAAKSRVPVAAHAHGDEGAAAAVRAGVRTIEHGTYVSDATLTLMKERGTCLVPTVATVEDLIHPGGDYDHARLSVRGRAMLPRVQDATARAWKMGARIVAGTDTGYGPNSNRRMSHEVAALVAAGMPPMAAIQSATSTAAACLGLERRTGAIRPGLEADLVVVERDPLADLTSLHDILVVINNGKVSINRLGW